MSHTYLLRFFINCDCEKFCLLFVMDSFRELWLASYYLTMTHVNASVNAVFGKAVPAWKTFSNRPHTAPENLHSQNILHVTGHQR